MLLFPGESEPFEDARVEISLEDTTYADAPASPVGRCVLEHVTHRGGAGEGIGFVLSRPPPPPGRQQSLRVLVDVDGDGRLGRGDYHNAESVPVPAGAVNGLEVRLRRVR
jgi:hypothetical protein